MQNRIRFSDLKARGIVNSRQTLENWIRDYGFPPGQLTARTPARGARTTSKPGSPAGPPGPRLPRNSKLRRGRAVDEVTA
jgi:hypothetical protein